MDFLLPWFQVSHPGSRLANRHESGMNFSSRKYNHINKIISLNVLTGLATVRYFSPIERL